MMRGGGWTTLSSATSVLSTGPQVYSFTAEEEFLALLWLHSLSTAVYYEPQDADVLFLTL